MVKYTRPSQLMETNIAHQRTAAKVKNQVMAVPVPLSITASTSKDIPQESTAESTLPATVRSQLMDTRLQNMEQNINPQNTAAKAKNQAMAVPVAPSTVVRILTAIPAESTVKETPQVMELSQCMDIVTLSMVQLMNLRSMAAKLKNRVMAVIVPPNTVADLLAVIPLKSTGKDTPRVTLRNQLMDIAI